jgi:hypothetical protein
LSTDFLFARPSLLRGMARVVDLGGRLDSFAYNFSSTPEEAADLAAAFDQTTSRVKEAQHGREWEG